MHDLNDISNLMITENIHSVPLLIFQTDDINNDSSLQYIAVVSHECNGLSNHQKLYCLLSIFSG